MSVPTRAGIAPPVSTVTPTAPSRAWVRHILGGGRIVESCPDYCTRLHSGTQPELLDDLVHGADEVSTLVEVFDHWHDNVAVTGPMEILSAQVRYHPYSENPRHAVPHVTFEPAPDDVMEGLSPDEFAAVIALLRAHCDRLDRVHAQLVQAVAEHNADGAR